MLKLLTVLAGSLFISAMAMSQGGHRNPIYDHALQLSKAGEYEESEFWFKKLLPGLSQLPAYQQLDQINGALEMFVSSLQWKKALAVARLGRPLLGSSKSWSAQDSLVLSKHFEILGDLGYSGSLASKWKRDQMASRAAYERAIELLPASVASPERIHRKLGALLRVSRDYERMQYHLLRGIELALASGNKVEEMRSRQVLGYWHGMLAYGTISSTKGVGPNHPQVQFDISQANSHLAAARKILNDSSTTGLRSLDTIKQSFYEGEISLTTYGNELAARKHLLAGSAVSLRNPSYSFVERRIFAQLGIMAYNETKTSKAEEWFERAEDIIEKYPNHREEIVKIISLKASTRARLDDFHAALPLYLQVNSVAQEAYAKDKGRATLYAYSLANVSYCLDNLGQIQASFDSSRKAIALFSQIPERERDHMNFALSLSGHAFMLLLDNQYQASLDTFLLSNDAFEKYSPLPVVIASGNRAAMALCYWKVGDKAKSEECAAIAKESLEAHKDLDPVTYSRYSNILGDFYLEIGRYEDALECYHSSIWNLSYTEPPSDRSLSPALEDITDRELGLEALRGKLLVFLARTREHKDADALRTALHQGTETIELTHNIRRQQSAQASQTDLSTKARPVFEEVLNLAWELSVLEKDPAYLEKAFDYAEQSRAMVLLAATTTDQAASSAGVPKILLTQLKELQAQSDEAKRTLNGETRQRVISKVTQQIVEFTFKQDSIRNILKSQYGKFYEQVYETKTVGIREVQDAIGEEKGALVEYFYGDSSLFTFAVTPDTFIVQREPISSQFEQNLDIVQSTLKTKSSGTTAYEYGRASHELYKFLLGDLGINLPEKILIVPDGRLNFLSFEALTLAAPSDERTNYNHLVYLLDSFIVSYDYSFTIRNRRGRYQSPYPFSVLAMAPSFDSEDLRELPVAQANIRSLQEEYADISAVIGKEATEDFFRREAKTYTVLDLATHGKMDSLNSADCRLHFSEDSLNDGKLHLGEIYSMDLHARMAVLEACESGLGPNARGEGVMSLARGFSYAGCHTIVTSLWNVADEEITQEIMRSFYANLADGLTVDVALAKAKRDYMAINRDSPGAKAQFYQPFFWAEMIVIGDTSPVPLERNGPLYMTAITWLVLFVAIIALAIGFRSVMKNRRKKHN